MKQLLLLMLLFIGMTIRLFCSVSEETGAEQTISRNLGSFGPSEAIHANTFQNPYLAKNPEAVDGRVLQALELSSGQLQFLLPINWASSPRYTLAISIPRSFIPLHAVKEWSDKHTTLMEFVPEGETGDGWTEILTLNKYIDKKTSADDLVSALKKRLLLQSENGKVWEDEREISPAYSHATCFLSYDYHGKHEVLGMEYFSGPYDCVGVQYTIRPQEHITDQQTIEKIQQYFNDSIKIIQ